MNTIHAENYVISKPLVTCRSAAAPPILCRHRSPGLVITRTPYSVADLSFPADFPQRNSWRVTSGVQLRSRSEGDVMDDGRTAGDRHPGLESRPWCLCLHLRHHLRTARGYCPRTLASHLVGVLLSLIVRRTYSKSTTCPFNKIKLSDYLTQTNCCTETLKLLFFSFSSCPLTFSDLSSCTRRWLLSSYILFHRLVFSRNRYQYI